MRVRIKPIIAEKILCVPDGNLTRDLVIAGEML